MTLKKLWQVWNDFWFAPGSPVPLAVFRIVIGILVLVFYWWISPEATTFFGRHSIVHESTVQRWMTSQQLDVLSLFPADDMWLTGMMRLLLLSGIGLMLGIFSRANALIVYLCLISLDSRNHFVLNTGVKIMIIMTLFLVFSRCGEALSIKRLVEVWRREPKFGPPQFGNVFSQRLIQMQMALVYWSAGTCKLHGSAWIDGSAVYYTAHLTQFQRFAVPYLFDHLWTCRLLSWGTVVFELSFPFLIWIKELRYPILLVGVLFHLGLDWSMVIPLFQLVMLAGYICFIDAQDFGKLQIFIQNIAQRFVKPVTVAYEGSSSVGCRLAETVRRLNVLNTVEVIEGTTHDFNRTATKIVVLSANGADLTGLDAVRRVMPRLPLLWLFCPLLLLPGLQQPVSALGAWLGKTYGQVPLKEQHVS